MTNGRPNEIEQHLGWMTGFLAIMSENNWRDMQLYLQRQVDRLRVDLARQGVIDGESARTEKEG